MPMRFRHAPSAPRRRSPARRDRRLGAESLEPRRLLAAFSYSGSALNVGLDAATTLSVHSSGTGNYVLSLSDGDTFTGTDTTGLTGTGTSTLKVTSELTLTNISISNTVDGTTVDFAGSSGSYVDDVAVKLSRIATGTLPAVRFKGSTAFADSASLSVVAPTISVIAASVSTVTGPLTLSGDTGAAVASPVTGLHISASSVSTAGGPLKLDGRGGNGEGGNLRGVAIVLNSQIKSGDVGTSFPTLYVNGTGGKSSGTGTGSDGVFIDDSSSVQTTGGSLVISGSGGGANDANRGIAVLGSVGVGSSAAAPTPALLALNGIGGGSGASAKDNNGVFLANSARITATSGSIQVSGTGGAGKTSTTAPYLSSPGVSLDSPTVAALGGPVTFTADGYSFGSSTSGLFITGSTLSVLNANPGQVMRLDSSAAAQLTRVAAKDIVIGKSDAASLPVIEQASVASGGTLAIGSPNLTVNGSAIRLRAPVTNTGSQTWNGPVILGADADAGDVVLSAKGITLSGPVDGAKNLTLRPGGGALAMKDAVGGTKALASLTIGPASAVTATKAVAIDGSAAGANPDGLTLESGANGVSIQAAGSSVVNAAGNGIRIMGSSGSTLSGFTLQKNGAGVYATGASPATTIRSNTITGNGTGVSIQAATDLTIDANTIVGNTAQGVYATGAQTGTKLVRNTIRNSPFGVVVDNARGLSVGGAGQGNVIAAGADAAGNRQPATGSYGLYATGNLTGTTLVANAVVDNAVGTYLVAAKGLVVNGRNLFYRNASHGILAVGDCLSTTIQQNIVDGTMPDGTKAAYGVYLLSATRMLLGGAGLGNGIYSCTVGVCATGSLSGSVVHGNSVINNVTGMVVVSGTGLIVSNNDFSSSTSAGFRASGICTSTTVSGNEIHHGGNGVILDGAQYMAVTSNRIYRNRGYGLLAAGAMTGTAAVGNTVVANGVNVETRSAAGGTLQRR
jgi:parallel beta-helix repeat protein